MDRRKLLTLVTLASGVSVDFHATVTHHFHLNLTHPGS
jgi:hypothetical protein